RARSSARLPPNVQLDLGATAKAWAADRAAAAAAAATGSGALVSLGGDIATSGTAPAGGWLIHVTDDHRSDPTAPGQTISTRSTGAVALLLLTAAVVLGVLDVRRVSSGRWPRFAIDSLHRSASVLAIAFLAVHILTAVLDSFAPISLLDAVVPFAGSYRPFWLGLGAVALDLLLAVAISSAVRKRIGFESWRAVHWLAYASWPIALVHG